jgi:hypothetical protein
MPVGYAGNSQILSSSGSQIQPSPDQNSQAPSQSSSALFPTVSLAGIPVTNPRGLRRWRAALADAQNNIAPIVAGYDSHSFGQNSNGSNTSNPGDSQADAQMGYVGQLRNLFALMYGNPGEGFILPNPAQEGRMVASGGSTFSAPGQAVAALRNNYRLGNGNTLTFTPPAGITQLGVVQTNHAGDAALSWTLNAVAQGNITAPTGTGIPSITWLTVVGGQQVVISGPAAGTNSIYGFVYSTGNVSANTALKNGVAVHRVGCGGYTLQNMIGGVYNGSPGTIDGVSFFTAAAQLAYAQAHYIWAGAKGLFIMYGGTNEQTLQNGVAGANNGVTPALFLASIQQIVGQIVSDGWCVLMVGAPPSGSENLVAPALPLTSYWSAMQQVASSTDHCAFVSIGDYWGGDDANNKALTAAAGLRDAGSSHPTRNGYGDLANMLYRVLTAEVPVGN